MPPSFCNIAIFHYLCTENQTAVMKHDLLLLTREVEKKIGKEINLSSDFDKLEKVFVKHHISLKSNALKKVWTFLTGREKPSEDTLDKIALFAGFQDWASFRKALHGDEAEEVSDDTESTQQASR